MNFNQCLLTGGSLLVLASQASGTASAQALPETPSEVPVAATPVNAKVEDQAGGDIIVTASKREERINSVPMSIQAETGAQLQAMGVRDPGQLQKLVPGFSAVRSRYGTPVYTIRGIGFQNSGLGANPTVSSYLDEAPVPYSAMTTGLTLDLARVEVLKGPQGTLFGNNSTGGALNFIAAKPTREFDAGVDVEYGRFDTLDLQGFVSGPLGDQLSTRIAVGYRHSGPWQESYTRDASLGRQDLLNGRASFLFEPSSDFSAMLTLSGFRDRGETQAAQFVFARPRGAATLPAGFLAYRAAPDNARAADWNDCVPRLSVNPLGESIGTGCGGYRKNNQLYSIGLRVEGQVSDDITLTSITSYQRFTRFQPEDQDGTTFQNYSDIPYGSIKTMSQELRLGGSFGGTGHWDVGGNFQYDDADDKILQTFTESSSNPVFGFLPLDDLILRGRQKVSTYAGFVHAEYPILSTVTAEIGLRYTQQDRAYRGCGGDSGNGQWAAVAQAVRNFIFTGNPTSGPAVSAGPGSCGSLGSAPAFLPEFFVSDLNENNLAWRGGLKWEPSRDTLVYGNVSRGYKSGSFPTLGASDNTQLLPVVQERLDAYEIGFKQSLFNRTLQVNGAAYYYNYRDKQLDGFVLSPIFGPLTALKNVPRSRVYGFELSADWTPVPGLSIRPAVSLADSKIQEFSDFDTFGAVSDFAGDAFPYAPKWQGTVNSQYKWDVSDRLSAFVGADLSYQSSTPGTLGDLPDFTIRPYTLLDLRAGVESGQWRFQVFGRNVTDKYYWTSVYYTNDGVIRFAGQPATYGASLSWRY